jgi:hypothetical protein
MQEMLKTVSDSVSVDLKNRVFVVKDSTRAVKIAAALRQKSRAENSSNLEFPRSIEVFVDTFDHSEN